MRIGFATSDWATRALDPLADRPSYGGSGWARVGLIAKHLRDLGDFDVFEGTLIWDRNSGSFGVREWPTSGMQDDEKGLFRTDLDLVVLQRWMFASIAAETATARASGQVVVNDLDDHFWALDPRNKAYASTDPQANLIENRDHYLRVIKASSAVTVSTPYLERELRGLGVKCPIHVMENRIDVSVFDDVWTNRIAGTPGGRSPVVGWVGATPWRSGDLETLRGVLGTFLDKHDLRAYHGGHLDDAEHFAYLLDLNPRRVFTRPMVPIFNYPSLLDPLDVGLVPLRDIPFNRAKSWIKGLEYAAAGVPFIGQDMGEYARLAEAGLGRVAKRPRDWLRHLGDLLDPETRRQEAMANRAAVEAYDIRKTIGEWRDLYLALIASS